MYKPQGILSNDNSNTLEEPTLEVLVQNINKEFKICHRLDRNTAGIVLFSKNKTAYNLLLDAFKCGFINKKYIAYVHGTKFAKDHDILEKYILIDKNNCYSKILDKKIKNSQTIITEYKVISKNKELDYSLLEVIIHTGKTHQIRAQLANIGHPIIGDQKYGKNELNTKFKIYKQLLFAYEYTFCFTKDNQLKYLNNTILRLNDTHLKIRFGRDINE